MQCILILSPFMMLVMFDEFGSMSHKATRFLMISNSSRLNCLANNPSHCRLFPLLLLLLLSIFVSQSISKGALVGCRVRFKLQGKERERGIEGGEELLAGNHISFY